jgi:pyruvate ferredoxin oxidoreductase alpha subunit
MRKRNQEAADLHIQAFKLAEDLSCPVMVCMDGFILTHAYEAVDLPTQKQVDAYLPPYEPRQVLDPNEPVSIGAMVGPEAFTEVRYLSHNKQIQALELIPELSREFHKVFGRDSGGLLREYRTASAETIVIALGSVNGTIQDTVDQMRDEGIAIGSVTLCTYRPFPLEAVRRALKNAKRVIVIDKSLAVGIGGILANDVRMALDGLTIPVYTVIAGLGGRPIPLTSLHKLFDRARLGDLEPVHFLDMRWNLIERQLEREKIKRRSGPIAENLLLDVGRLGPRIPLMEGSQ